MRLGELLLSEGLITSEQMEAALSNQILHGGRLGSNLIEVGAINMEALAHALGRLHVRPPVLNEHFQLVDSSLVQKLTPLLAANWHVVPLWYTSMEPLQVAVACLAPLNEEVREELQTIFGADILEAIAPEMRMYYWLEQLYQIKRLNRFKRSSRQVRTKPSRNDTMQIPRGFIESLEDTDVHPSGGELARIAVKRVAVPVASIQEAPTDYSDWKACVRTVRQSTGREALAENVSQVLQKGLTGQFTASLLLMVKDTLAIGWKGLVGEEENTSVDALAIPLLGQSIFTTPYSRREAYHGPSLASPSIIDERFWRFLGSVPAELSITPVILMDEVACIIYVQSNTTIEAATLGSLEELSSAVSAALTRLIRSANR